MKFLISFLLRKVPRKYLQIISSAGIRLVSVFYIGNKVECVVCGKHYRKFLPYGRLSPRENALCPNCLSLERHRLIWLYLKEKTNFFTDHLKVLHIAPEICFATRFENLSNLDYITADIESPWAKVKMDIHKIPFEQNTFDVIFCNHVTEHLEDDKKAFREMLRVLKPGGWAIMQPFIDNNLEKTYEDPTVTSPKDREKHFRQNDHRRIYGRDYKARLEKEGFKVTADEYVKRFDKKQIALFGISAGEAIYVCKKELANESRSL